MRAARPRNAEPRRAIFVLYVLAMVLLFLLPVPPRLNRAAGQFDGAVHFGVFLGFSLLYRLGRRPAVARALLVSVLLAGGVELVQWALPYRGGQWADFAFGAAGAGAGVVLAHLVRARPGRPADPAP